jgi:hypothetical protein
LPRNKPSQAEQAAARKERRSIYRSDNRMQRAAATIWLALAELSPVEQLTVLQAAISEALEAHKKLQR